MGRGLTLGSLFDGIGGFCYAAYLTGRIKPIWVAEIEPNCVSVTRYRFPEVMHVGSVTELKHQARRNAKEGRKESSVKGSSIEGKRAEGKGSTEADCAVWHDIWGIYGISERKAAAVGREES